MSLIHRFGDGNYQGMSIHKKGSVGLNTLPSGFQTYSLGHWYNMPEGWQKNTRQ